jgi:hypothetical protein
MLTDGNEPVIYAAQVKAVTPGPGKLGRKIQAETGGMPEWLKGTDCKSVGSAYAGSNPAPSTIPSHGS